MGRHVPISGWRIGVAIDEAIVGRAAQVMYGGTVRGWRWMSRIKADVMDRVVGNLQLVATRADKHSTPRALSVLW